MSNPNEGQWNGQTGQPNQSQPSQPNPAGQPGQPQYGAYDSNHGGQYPPQGAPGAQDTQNQQAQNGQPQGGPNQNPYYGPYAYNPNYGPNGQPAWGPDGRRYQADGQSNSQADGQPNGPWGDQSQPGWQQTNWYVGNFSPFHLIEEWLPEKAKTKIRIIYGVVRIVSALVEPGLPGGWRVLDVFVGILLTFGGVVVVRNYGMTGQTLALLITLMVGFGWIMEGVMALVESWRIPRSGWAIAYAIISIIAGFVVLMSPLSSAVFMIIFGGCAMVVMGITSVIRAFTFGKRRK